MLQAFKSYDEAGVMRRIQCLKYLVLANMLMESNVDPFDAQVGHLCDGRGESVADRTEPTRVGPGACSCPGWRPSLKAAMLCSMLEGSSMHPAMSRQQCQAVVQAGRCQVPWAQVQVDGPRCKGARRWVRSAVGLMTLGEWCTRLLCLHVVVGPASRPWAPGA